MSNFGEQLSTAELSENAQARAAGKKETGGLGGFEDVGRPDDEGSAAEKKAREAQEALDAEKAIVRKGIAQDLEKVQTAKRLVEARVAQRKAKGEDVSAQEAMLKEMEGQIDGLKAEYDTLDTITAPAPGETAK